MILREMSMHIQYLAQENVPKARIARQFGVSRQTVYNHLNREGPFPKPRARRISKLEAFKSYIRSRLERFDLPVPVLLAELKEKGYSGGITILREFVGPLKEAFTRKVTERFETLPGQQAQMDWGQCGYICVEDQRKTLYVFVLVLGYSRMMWARFTTSCRLPVLLTCLKGAIESLGIPREVLVDNMKQAVDQHEVTTGLVRWNPTFLDFARHYGFLPVACPPYWPRVKGKVERGVAYIKTSFLEGRTFADLDDLNRQLLGWLEGVASVRVHGTTGQRPIDRYADEQARLRQAVALPAFDTRPILFRQVPLDSHITYQGVRYSVDPQAVGRTVLLRPEGDRPGTPFSIYLGDRVVGIHICQPSGSRPVLLEAHAQAIRRLNRSHPDSTCRIRGRQPRFLQTPPPASPGLPASFQALESQVEVRSLEAYQALVEEGLR